MPHDEGKRRIESEKDERTFYLSYTQLVGWRVARGGDRVVIDGWAGASVFRRSAKGATGSLAGKLVSRSINAKNAVKGLSHSIGCPHRCYCGRWSAASRSSGVISWWKAWASKRSNSLGEELKAGTLSRIQTRTSLRLHRHRPLDDMTWVPIPVSMQNTGAQGTSLRSSNHTISDVSRGEHSPRAGWWWVMVGDREWSAHPSRSTWGQRDVSGSSGGWPCSKLQPSHVCCPMSTILRDQHGQVFISCKAGSASMLPLDSF